MHTINNKFETGEECYSVYRKPIRYTCPICDGKGYFTHAGYDIDCRNCGGSGYQTNPKQCVLEVCKVTVRRIIASIWKDHITIKYKVDSINPLVHVTNRGEASLFKTAEEAERYCKDANTKQITPEF